MIRKKMVFSFGNAWANNMDRKRSAIIHMWEFFEKLVQVV